MSFETTKDVLEHAREFHRDVSEFYGRLTKQPQKERVKILLEYMSRHEKHLEESLAQYEEGVSEKILNTWFQYPPPKETLDLCKKMTIEGNENLTVEQVIKMALELDECLVNLYKAMIESAETEEVKEVFENLLAMEKQEEMDMVRDTLQFDGI
jgi:rubrerythrin